MIPTSPDERSTDQATAIEITGRQRSPSRRWAISLVMVAGSLAACGAGAWYWRYESARRAETRCLQAMKERRWDDARGHVEEWVRLRPDAAAAWLARAEVARQKKDWPATEESLARIPPSDDRYLRAQALRADLALDGLRDPHRAAGIWQDVLRIAPTADTAHQRLIYIYAMTLQRKAMLEQIRTAIRRHAEPPEAYGYLLAANSLLFSDGYPRVSQWLRQQPDDETLRVAHAVFAARTNPSKGQRMFGVGDGLKANLGLIEQCRQDYPDNLEVRAYFIEQAIGEADFARLGELVERLPPAADEDARFWRYRGTWLDSQQRFEEALAAYERSLRRHPLDWKTHHELAGVARILSRAELAARHADLAQRGKQLEQQILELPNAAQADESLMRRVLNYARDCGDQDVVNGLAARLPT